MVLVARAQSGHVFFCFVLRGLYNGFEILTTKTIVKTKQSNAFSSFLNSLKFVCFSVSLNFDKGVHCLSWSFIVVLGFYTGSELLTTKPL